MEHLTSTQWSVSKLIDFFLNGQLAVPEIQRDVVWDADQVKLLIDSIARDYPCGSLILWEPRLSDKSLVKDIIRPERLLYFKNIIPKYFLIDGQQRVTALASLMLERVFLKNLEPEIDEQLPSLHVDLKRFPKTIESAIEAASNAEPAKYPAVLINDIFTGVFKESSDYSKLAKGKAKELDQFIQQIRDYQFPVQIIQDSKYETVGNIFARVNSQGTQLTGAEIHLASIIPHWQGISAEFRQYRLDLRKNGYDLDLTFLMRAITVIACDVAQIKKLAEKVALKGLDKSKGLDKTKLNRIWKESKRAINSVSQILRDGLLLDKTKLFLSKNALVPLVYYVAKSSRKPLKRNAMMKYFIVSQLGGRYGSGGESVLRKDINLLHRTDTLAEGLQDLLDDAISEAKLEYRGLKISPSQVNGITSKNVMLLMMYIIMRKRGATDFGLNENMTLDQISSESLQLHHIFPFDFMMNDSKALEFEKNNELKRREYRDLVNDIANITFISQKKNGGIGNIAPTQYLNNETTREIRKAHFIPEDKDLWRPENYGKFLTERRKMMAKAMNALIKSLH